MLDEAPPAWLPVLIGAALVVLVLVYVMVIP
jgi:hypothetical protein